MTVGDRSQAAAMATFIFKLPILEPLPQVVMVGDRSQVKAVALSNCRGLPKLSNLPTGLYDGYCLPQVMTVGDRSQVEAVAPPPEFIVREYGLPPPSQHITAAMGGSPCHFRI